MPWFIAYVNSHLCEDKRKMSDDDSCSSVEDVIPEDHVVCIKYRNLLHRLYRDDKDAYTALNEAEGELLLNLVTTLLSDKGITMEQADSDAMLAGTFIWHSAVQRLDGIPSVVTGDSLLEQPPSAKLQRAIRFTKHRFLRDRPRHQIRGTCCILTCPRMTMFSLEQLPFCEIHAGLSLLYALRSTGTEGFTMLGPGYILVDPHSSF